MAGGGRTKGIGAKSSAKTDWKAAASSAARRNDFLIKKFMSSE
jgi:hypothetical protein